MMQYINQEIQHVNVDSGGACEGLVRRVVVECPRRAAIADHRFVPFCRQETGRETDGVACRALNKEYVSFEGMGLEMSNL
ncbi:hypothetical protein DPMN_128000 [Dreissena polymorpha]|uniref:Uncharacterized protein n=1 Tax=Dreissena polymorpha TaxID=45954 RepID=A0A9D4H0A3_DREPO|nr:hypothetical protein DPMN_128000 [Dreissena polymorpha]